jgi:amphi-Trp domain-containing protein
VQIKREVSLREAIGMVRSFLDNLEAGAVSVGDHEVGADDTVRVELEIESGEHDLELEFEIKWSAPAAESARAFASTGGAEAAETPSEPA